MTTIARQWITATTCTNALMETRDRCNMSHLVKLILTALWIVKPVHDRMRFQVNVSFLVVFSVRFAIVF